MPQKGVRAKTGYIVARLSEGVWQPTAWTILGGMRFEEMNTKNVATSLALAKKALKNARTKFPDERYELAILEIIEVSAQKVKNDK